MKKTVQFGAGSIGRGFLAQLFTQSGYRVVFAEVDPVIIENLNSRGSYTLSIVGDNPRDILIENVSAVNARDAAKVASEISDADIMATAVGANILPVIAPLIASGIAKRAESGAGAVDIIICENLLHAGAALKSLVKEQLGNEHHGYLDSSVGFVETVVSRMIPVLTDEMRRQDPLLVKAEEYAVLPADMKAFKGGIPSVRGLLPTENFAAFEERKLFIHNLGHAVCAYRGAEKNLTYIWEAVADSEINALARNSLEESSAALIKKHGFTRKEMREHIEDLLKRFANRDLGDTVGRVARDPVRKLGPNDRLTGAALNCLREGVPPENIVKTIVSALGYRNPDDEGSLELEKMIRQKGVEHVLDEICGLKNEQELKGMINSLLKRDAIHRKT